MDTKVGRGGNTTEHQCLCGKARSCEVIYKFKDELCH